MTQKKPGRPAKEVKPQQFSIRLMPSEYSALQDLAVLFGSSLSGAIERCVKERWALLSGAEKRALETIRAARNLENDNE